MAAAIKFTVRLGNVALHRSQRCCIQLQQCRIHKQLEEVRHVLCIARSSQWAKTFVVKFTVKSVKIVKTTESRVQLQQCRVHKQLEEVRHALCIA
jgi:hypothetical protein